MLNKVLVYHLHVSDTIRDNKNYYLHQTLLKYYKNCFDEFVFYVVTDKINDKEIINDAILWVSDICINKKYTIKIRKNTYLCEVNTFDNELLKLRHQYKQSLVFFAHSKNSTKFEKDFKLKYNKDDLNAESLIKWTIALYFYSLNFTDEAERKLLAYPTPGEMFFGSLLTQARNDNFTYYSGAFFWLNMARFNNYIDDENKIPNITDRYWVERLPGNICHRDYFGGGVIIT